MQGDSVIGVENTTRGQEVIITATLKNAQQIDQSFVYIVEIFSPTGIVESMMLDTGEFERGQLSTISRTWHLSEELALGTYEIKILVLSDLDAPFVLAEVATTSIDILGNEQI
jgi:hypothetical protein